MSTYLGLLEPEQITWLASCLRLGGYQAVYVHEGEVDDYDGDEQFSERGLHLFFERALGGLTGDHENSSVFISVRLEERLGILTGSYVVRDLDQLRRSYDELDLIRISRNGEVTHVETLFEQPLLYGIGGDLGSGKTAVAHHLAAEHDFTNVTFQDPIHESLALINPTVHTASGPVHQNDIVERLGLEAALASYPEMVGNARSYANMLRSGYPATLLVTKAESAIQSHLDNGISVVVDGVTSTEEVAMIRELGGRVVWVEREGFGEAAEGVLDACDFDLVLGNGGTLTEMFRRAEWMLLGLSE